jgi:hypothetical protein
MCEAFTQRVASGLDDVIWRIKIGFADFQMNNVFALALQLTCTIQDFKCSFRAKSRHPLGQLQLELNGTRHRTKRIIVLLEEKLLHRGRQRDRRVIWSGSAAEFPWRFSRRRIQSPITDPRNADPKITVMIKRYSGLPYRCHERTNSTPNKVHSKMPGKILLRLRLRNITSAKNKENCTIASTIQ